ncbi:MAG: phosphoribosyltransferase family protein [Acidimicrobiales bacterium]
MSRTYATNPTSRTSRLADTVLPHRCAGCRQLGAVLCEPCRTAIGTSPTTIVPGGITAALTFDGVVRSAILGLKFRNRRAAARALAQVLVRRLGLRGPGRPHYDLVTWAPTSRRRVADRGYDQAELLARAVAAELGVPCRRLLYRVHGAPQVGRTRAERLAGPTFRGRPGRSPRVLVVDDVVTTGATLTAAGEALHQAGVREVRLVAVAATPARARLHAVPQVPAGGALRGGAPAREQAPGRLESA